MMYLLLFMVAMSAVLIILWAVLIKSYAKNYLIAQKIVEERIRIEKSNSESKYYITNSIEVYLQSLTKQKLVCEHLIDRVEEELQVLDIENTERAEQLTKSLSMNSEILERTTDSIRKLESWYFSNQGRHYMLLTESRYFSDESLLHSKN